MLGRREVAPCDRCGKGREGGLVTGVGDVDGVTPGVNVRPRDAFKRFLVNVRGAYEEPVVLAVKYWVLSSVRFTRFASVLFFQGPGGVRFRLLGACHIQREKRFNMFRLEELW